MPLSLPDLAISPTPEAAPFWEACREGRLILPYCPRCARAFFYPRTACPRCGSREITWRDSGGRGRLYTYTVQHRPASRALREIAPFVTAVVELDEGPRLMTFLVGVPPDPRAIRCDMAVEVDFAESGGHVVPVFRPRA